MNATRWLQGTIVLAVVIGLNQPWCIASDKKKNAQEPAKSAKTPTAAEHPTAFLGVMIEDLHPAIASHVGGELARDQGVLVSAVSADAPAARAGVKPHDILVTYDDQKLFSPEQLFKLVASDKPGREVTLGLIRQGKPETLKLKLGERTYPVQEPQAAKPAAPHRPLHFSWPWQMRRGPAGRHTAETRKPGWNSFDSMTLKKLDKDRFHASINHTDKDGKLQKHEFEGTLEEIQKQVEADTDLLPDERKHLLRSLNLQDPGFPFWIIPDEDWSDF